MSPIRKKYNHSSLTLLLATIQAQAMRNKKFNFQKYLGENVTNKDLCKPIKQDRIGKRNKSIMLRR